MFTSQLLELSVRYCAFFSSRLASSSCADLRLVRALANQRWDGLRISRSESIGAFFEICINTNMTICGSKQGLLLQ